MEIVKAMLIDGNALIYKCYYAIAYISKKETDNESEIIVQMMSLLHKIIKNLLNRNEYKYAAAVFDSSRKTFRSEKLESYKSQRPKMPEALFNSIPKIFQLFQDMGIKTVISPKLYEADDLIGSLSNKWNNLDICVDIYSTDKDLLQLVNHWTSVNLLKRGVSDIRTYNHNNFQELTDGLLPYQIPFFKSLAGDSSDNYKGMPGFGNKTSIEIVKKFKNQQKLYDSIDCLSDKVKNLLTTHQKDVNLYLEIAEIVKTLEIKEPLSEYLLKTDIL